MQSLDPSSFALVMATGVISVDIRVSRLMPASTALLYLAALGYLILVGLFGWRLLSHPGLMRAELTDPRRGFGFFTFPAGTNVLGARLAADGRHAAAVTLLVIGVIGWLWLGYAVPGAALVGGGRAALAAANGDWFLWVVATQSVAVLAASLAPGAGAWASALVVLAVACWSIGVVLYIGVAVFAAARLVLHPPSPAELTPPYWIAMGATAITTLAGARIVETTGALAATSHAFVAGASLVSWLFGAWLIPPLLIAGWWRHVRHRFPVRYEVTWWSVVFPLGMYAAAGRELGLAERLGIVESIGRYMTWPAAAAWVAAFIAVARFLVLWCASRRGDPSIRLPK